MDDIYDTEVRVEGDRAVVTINRHVPDWFKLGKWEKAILYFLSDVLHTTGADKIEITNKAMEDALLMGQGSLRQIKGALRKLEERGYITIEHRFTASGQSLPNYYRVAKPMDVIEARKHRYDEQLAEQRTRSQALKEVREARG